jgi:hypothetical protein
MAVEQDIRFQKDTLGAPAKSRGAKRSALRSLSLLLRRSHMYLALFLTPWMAMYALSTLVFNHFERVAQHYGGEIERYEKEKELAYSKAFPPGTSPRTMAEEILRDLNLSGTLRVEQHPENRMVILRLDPVAPRKITYFQTEKRLLVEKQVFRTPVFLTALHSRLGYGSKHKINDAWAFGVDLSIFATFLWVLSGFWLWWESKAARRWGVFFAAAGICLFGAFLLLA